jgi:hypothetical protein
MYRVGPGTTPQGRTGNLGFEFYTKGRFPPPFWLVEPGTGACYWRFTPNGDNKAVSLNTLHVYHMPWDTARVDTVHQVIDVCERFGVELEAYDFPCYAYDQVIGGTAGNDKWGLRGQSTNHAYFRITGGRPDVLLRIVHLLDQTQFVLSKTDNKIVTSQCLNVQLSDRDLVIPMRFERRYTSRSYLYGPRYGPECKHTRYHTPYDVYPWVAHTKSGIPGINMRDLRERIHEAWSAFDGEGTIAELLTAERRTEITHNPVASKGLGKLAIHCRGSAQVAPRPSEKRVGGAWLVSQM